MSFYKEVPGRQTTIESTLKFDTEPKAGSTNPVTSDGVAKSNADILDDGDTGVEEEEIGGIEYYNSHVVGNFYFEHGKLWKCTNKTRDGEPGSYTYTTKIEKMNGIVPVLNDFNNQIGKKSNSDEVLAVADAYILRRGQVGEGWYKIAETTTPRNNYNINSVFNVVASTSNLGEYQGFFTLSVRYEGTGVVNVFTKSFFCDNWLSINPIKIVTTKISNTKLKVELFVGVNPSNTTTAVYAGISISEMNAGNYGGINKKNTWTYNSYTDVAGSAAPVDDPDNNKTVFDVTIEPRVHQKDIDDLMTNDNGDHMTETPPQQVYVTDKFYFVNGKICRCTAYSADSATFDVYGVVEAMNFILSQT